jgi:hypothetical protein
MAQITYTNKETLNSQPSIADKNKVTSSDMNEIKSVVNTNYGEVGNITNLTTTDKTSVVNAINENTKLIDKIGKQLWEGSFTSGSITVDGLSNYTIIVVMLEGDVPCIGTANWGFGGICRYGGYQIDNYAYRFYPNGNVLTIDTYNKGGTNGSSQVAVKKIYGIF